MNFATDLALSRVELGGAETFVAFRAPDETVFDGLALSRDYTMTYPIAELATLAPGDVVTVDGTSYRVRDLHAIGDGSETRVTLSRI